MSATNKHRTATIDAMAHRERLRFITPLHRAATRKFCRRWHILTASDYYTMLVYDDAGFGVYRRKCYQ